MGRVRHVTTGGGRGRGGVGASNMEGWSLTLE